MRITRISERKRLIFSVIAVSLVGIATGLFLGGDLLPSQAAYQMYDERVTTTTTDRRVVHGHDGLGAHEHIVTTGVTTTETTPHGYFHDFAATMTQGITPTPTSSTSTQGADEVWLVGTNFIPWTITVPVGTKITWINKSTQAHTITSDSGLFDESLRFNGNSFSYTFTSRGVFSYHCTPHTVGGMIGKVIVE